MATKNIEDKKGCDFGYINILPDGGARFEDEHHNILAYFNPKDNRVTNKDHHVIGDGNEHAADLLYEVFIIRRSGLC